MSGILGWGKASNGQLGLKGEDLIAVTTPRQISDLNAADILGIACGANYTLVYLRDGTLHSCGENEFNQLGHDKSERKFSKNSEYHFCQAYMFFLLYAFHLAFNVF